MADNESLLDVDDIRTQGTDLFSAGGAVNPEAMDYTGGSEPLEVHAGYVDAGFFKVLGVPPMLGQQFAPGEDHQGGPRAVVLTYSFWRKYLSAIRTSWGVTLAQVSAGMKAIDSRLATAYPDEEKNRRTMRSQPFAVVSNVSKRFLEVVRSRVWKLAKISIRSRQLLDGAG